MRKKLESYLIVKYFAAPASTLREKIYLYLLVTVAPKGRYQ
jgi:hypothetical protein